MWKVNSWRSANRMLPTFSLALWSSWGDLVLRDVLLVDVRVERDAIGYADYECRGSECEVSRLVAFDDTVGTHVPVFTWKSILAAKFLCTSMSKPPP